MVTTNRMFMLFALALFTLTACTSTPEEPIVADPDGFASDVLYFESAYNELNEAIIATSSWETSPKYDIRVRGLAELAHARADALHPYVAQDLISDAAITLMKREVNQRARIEDSALKAKGGTHIRRPEDQLRTFSQESAYHRIWQQIDTLESFAMAQRTTPWLDSVVIASARGDLQTIVSMKLADAATWTRVNLSPDSFVHDQQRARDLLDRLDGKVPQEPVD
ncbi:MAG: hypothetical protein ACI97A_000511 [Planctomycetota bacterium]|jgi:hypothetical protein